MELLTAVREFVHRERLFDEGALLVVGVSGGPDSVALLDVLRRLGMRLHVAHLHHGIRGSEADADADFVRQLAAGQRLPCTIERIDVPTVAQTHTLALEEAARRVRYAFLAQVALRTGAHTIAVGHHADDQAETVLMHLLRGTGLAGLRGMLPATPLRDYRQMLFSALTPPLTQDAVARHALTLVRPLLETPRNAVEAYCETHNLPTRFDRSNLDQTYFRNRLRREVLPYLAEINPRISERLCNLADVARAGYTVIETATQATWEGLVRHDYPDGVVFDLLGWRAQPLAIRRALIRRAAYRLKPTLRDVDFVHVAHAIEIGQQGATGDQATLPGGLALRIGYDTLTIGETGAQHLPPERPWLAAGADIRVTIPGSTPLPEGWRLVATEETTWHLEEIAGNPDPLTAWLDGQTLAGSCRLRTRKRGDRFAPQGMGGKRARLSDFLISAKIPLAYRDRLPLLEAGGEILWVVGARVSERASVRPDTEHVVKLECQRDNPWTAHQGRSAA